MLTKQQTTDFLNAGFSAWFVTLLLAGLVSLMGVDVTYEINATQPCAQDFARYSIAAMIMVSAILTAIGSAAFLLRVVGVPTYRQISNKIRRRVKKWTGR